MNIFRRSEVGTRPKTPILEWFSTYPQLSTANRGHSGHSYTHLSTVLKTWGRLLTNPGVIHRRGCRTIGCQVIQVLSTAFPQVIHKIVENVHRTAETAANQVSAGPNLLRYSTTSFERGPGASCLRTRLSEVGNGPAAWRGRADSSRGGKKDRARRNGHGRVAVPSCVLFPQCGLNSSSCGIPSTELHRAHQDFESSSEWPSCVKGQRGRAMLRVERGLGE